MDTVHRAGCKHNLLPDRLTGTQPSELAAETVEDAQREIARAMGWCNWPDESDYEFDIVIAPCAR